ncbi:histidine kinase [Pedobacter sp. PLR]|uniref:sensor histidine kinase n=1 Tax=Pedobacter sp. PLR TaxID=2994465 RepID=UPI0022466209|nr:histidine kinase [Pedobacter sp. PLR]MCX2452548.1 histidine kinase [Pedobacter sp. PLR]
MTSQTQELKNRQIINFLSEDRYRFLRHAGLLLGLFVLFYYSDLSSQFSGIYKYYRLLCIYTVFIIMFYVNMYVLVPLFFFKAKYLLYLVLVVGLVMTGLFFSGYMLKIIEPHRLHLPSEDAHRIRSFYEGAMITVPIIMLTTTIKLLQRWIKDNDRISALKELTLHMELNELKNQINPHFLFNMLNNVKALIRTDPEKAALVILKLSEFLRYQLYENNEKKTALTSEINFISNFLNLEKIRRDNFSFHIGKQTDEPLFRSVFIPPNLFTTFVENAVKHSVDISGAAAFINIEIAILQDKLHFFCTNSKSPDEVITDQKYSGLGLINIKRRLELLYQQDYSLELKSNDHEYSIHLTIPV